MKDAVSESAEGSGFGRVDSFYAIVSSQLERYPQGFGLHIP